MTGRDRRVLDALRALTEDGWPASTRDVAARLGVASPSGIHESLHELAAAGLAEQHPRNPALGWRASPRSSGESDSFPAAE